MITITRSLARQIRPVFRRALLGSSRGAGPAVVLEAGPDGLVIRAKTNGTAIAHHMPGDFPSGRLSLPFQFLADCEGRGKEPVILERQDDGKVTAQWTDDSIPQLLQYESVDGRVWPDSMAGLIPLVIESYPVLVPQTAVVQGSEGHHGFGVVAVPTPAAAFDAVRGGFAFGFGWP